MSLKSVMVKARNLGKDKPDTLSRVIKGYLSSLTPDRRGEAGKYDFHISQLHYMCERQETYFRLNTNVAQASFGSRSMVNMDVGTGVHQVFENWLRDAGALFGAWGCDQCLSKSKEGFFADVTPFCNCRGREIRYLHDAVRFELEYGYAIVGTTDGLAAISAKDKPGVFEFKTMASSWWNRLKNPLPAHVDQILMYMRFIESEAPGRLVYLNKDTSSPKGFPLKEFVVNYDEISVNAMIAKAQAIIDAILSNDPNSGKMMCKNDTCARAKRCPLRSKCFV